MITSFSKNKSTRKFERSPEKSTDYKLSRNLQLDFENYSLKEQSAEYYDSQLNQPLEDTHSHQINRNLVQSEYKVQKRGNGSVKKNPNFHQNRQNKQNRLSSSKEYTYNSHKKGKAEIPRSYLLAMESLQEAVQAKDKCIEEMKSLLLEKEESILESETRINDLLWKYEEVVSLCEDKDKEINILKSQIQQARIDQDNAIKQAARAMEQQMKAATSKNAIPNCFIHHIQTNQKRSRVASINPNHLSHARKLNYEDQHQYEPLQSQTQYIDQTDRSIINSKSKRAFSTYNKASSSHQDLLSHKNSAIFSNAQPANSNFISYQREIFRNQKQLTALHYYMQCLERKLIEFKNEKGSFSKQKKRGQSQRERGGGDKSDEEEIKKKIRQLRKEIEDKQSILVRLKRI